MCWKESVLHQHYTYEHGPIQASYFYNVGFVILTKHGIIFSFCIFFNTATFLYLLLNHHKHNFSSRCTCPEYPAVGCWAEGAFLLSFFCLSSPSYYHTLGLRTLIHSPTFVWPSISTTSPPFVPELWQQRGVLISDDSRLTASQATTLPPAKTAFKRFRDHGRWHGLTQYAKTTIYRNVF